MSKHSRHLATQIAVAFSVAAMLIGCYANTPYYRYDPTDLKGWDRAEVFEHHVPPVAEEGYYVEEIGVRTDASFRYQSLSLVVDQWIIHTKTHEQGRFKSDTVSIEIYNPRGQAEGRGVHLLQYTYPLKSVKLQQGDSIALRIRHNMKNKSIVGVANVGFKLTSIYD